MTRLMSSVVGFVFLASLATPGRAQTVVFDNGGPDLTSYRACTGWVQAEDFSLTESTELAAMRYFSNEQGSGWDGSLEYFVFDDNAGQPGVAPIASGTAQNVQRTNLGPGCCGGTLYEVVFAFESFVSLAAGTYWVGIHCQADFATQFPHNAAWALTSAGSAATAHESITGTFDNWVDNGDDLAFQLLSGTTDHFLCYKAKTSKQSFNVNLVDQFDSGAYEGKKAKHFCTPADKNGEGIQDPDTHLEDYKVKGPHAKKTRVLIANQFGEFFFDTTKTDTLLVPTAKSLAPDPAPGLPTGVVDHFRCLKAKTSKGEEKFPKGITADVVDQFGTRGVTIKKPSRLCVPTDKNGEGIVSPDNHLMCYKVKPDPKTSAEGIQVNNQLGAATIAITLEKELCVPSLKSLTCGDNVNDGGAEECDGTDTPTCESLGFSAGTATCDETCEIDTSGCTICGNNTTEPGEECDGTDDTACPGVCGSLCSCPELSPVTETLEPCTAFDTWSFSVAAGQTVLARADTTNPATASDLVMMIDCLNGDAGFGDDDFACTFPPPLFSCPEVTFVASGNTPCTVFVDGLSTCTDPNLANYELSVTLDTVHTLLTLQGDDQ